MNRCRVVVSTCMTAGILYALGLPVGHFSHVVIDEAGQATEPEALIPAALLARHPHGQVREREREREREASPFHSSPPPHLPPSLSLPPSSQLVLAGDPHQLGPVLTSRQAGSLGLSLSLLERIMARGAYLRDPAKYSDHGSYDPLMVGVVTILCRICSPPSSGNQTG